jgi:hypothetical protein
MQREIQNPEILPTQVRSSNEQSTLTSCYFMNCQMIFGGKFKNYCMDSKHFNGNYSENYFNSLKKGLLFNPLSCAEL